MARGRAKCRKKKAQTPVYVLTAHPHQKNLHHRTNAKESNFLLGDILKNIIRGHRKKERVPRWEEETSSTPCRKRRINKDCADRQSKKIADEKASPAAHDPILR